MKVETPTLQGTSVVLRPMSHDYVTETYLGWLSDAEVTHYIAAVYTDLSKLSEYVSQRLNDETVRFWAICDRTTGRHIGNVKLEPISTQHSRATFGILIGDKEFWGRGISRQVTELVSQFAFDILHINKVDLGVVFDNIAAWKSYEKAGFHIEGRFRQHERQNGKLVDVLRMAKFADGFKPN